MLLAQSEIIRVGVLVRVVFQRYRQLRLIYYKTKLDLLTDGWTNPQ